MQKNAVQRLVVMSLSAVLLSACGGAGDDDSGTGPLATSMTSIDLTGATTSTCYDGFAYRVYVYDGVPPYRIQTDVPDALVFDKTTVGNKGQSFDVSANGVCFAKGSIIVTDQLNKRVQITVTNKVGTATTP